MYFKEVQAATYRAAANIMNAQGRNPLCMLFANDERSITGNFAIYCVFEVSETHQFEGIKINIADSELKEYHSLVPIIPAAAWYEREIYDLFGIKPIGHPDLRPLVLHNTKYQDKYPMWKDFQDVNSKQVSSKEDFQVEGKGIFEVPVGPIHAGIIEPGHFSFAQAGENVLHLEAKLFYTHRGIEKSLEGLSIEEAIYKIERICGACSVSHALSFCQAVEALGKLDIRENAKWLRMLAAELERLYNHIGDIGNLCAGIGFQIGVSHGSRMKEALMRLNETLTGNRFLRGFIVPGGVKYGVDRDIISNVEKVIKKLMPDFEELVEILKDNNAFLNRVQNTGILPFGAAKDLAVVGVAARASGIETDIRKDHPYALYGSINFRVPVYQEGDVFARFWVRVEEVKQSFKILQQVCHRITFEKNNQVTIPVLPAYQSSIGYSESARGANLHWLMLDKDNKIYRYVIRSASYANWPAVTVAVPGNILADFPLINKSFELCYACIDR